MGSTFGLQPPQPNPHKPGQLLNASAVATNQRGNGTVMSPAILFSACCWSGDRYMHAKFEKKKARVFVGSWHVSLVVCAVLKVSTVRPLLTECTA